MANNVDDLDDFDPTVHHEESDINVRGALIFTALSVLSAVVLHFGVWYMYSAFAKAERKKDVVPLSEVKGATQDRVPPGPRLQPFPEEIDKGGETVPSGVGSELSPVPRKDPKLSTPVYDMQQLRRQYDEKLTTYGWVDRRSGIVRIPIAEAKKKLLEKGLPVRQATAANAPAATASTQPAAAAAPANEGEGAAARPLRGDGQQ